MFYAILYSGWRNEKKFSGYDDLIEIYKDYENALKYVNKSLQERLKEIEYDVNDHYKEDLFTERKDGTKSEIHRLVLDCCPYGKYCFEYTIKSMKLK